MEITRAELFEASKQAIIDHNASHEDLLVPVELEVLMAVTPTPISAEEQVQE